VLASLAVALTVTPALALVVLGHAPSRVGDPPLQTAMKGSYHRLLLWVWRHERTVLTAVGVTSVIAFATLPFLGGEFLPDFKEHHLVLQVAAVPGTSLDAMRRIGGRLSRDILALPLIRTVEQQIGRAEQGEDTWGPNRSEFHVELQAEHGGDDDRVTEDIRSLLAEVPGIQYEVLTFLGDRISETRLR
jgi:Cu/Ag efflux pump CusA